MKTKNVKRQSHKKYNPLIKSKETKFKKKY